MNLKLYIDQLTLEGLTLTRSQRPQMQASVEAELLRLFTKHGIPKTIQQGEKITHLPTNLAITGKPNPTQIGQHVAQSIYKRLQTDSARPNTIKEHPSV